jgi:putative transposase
MEEVVKDVIKAFKTAKQTKNAEIHFKTRKDRLQTFRVYKADENVFKVENDNTLSMSGGRFGRITLTTRESLNFLGNPGVVKLCELTISHKAGEYWMCITYEKPNHTMQPAPTGSRVGLDLGVKKSVVAYDGKTFSEASFNTKRSLKFDAMSKAQNAQLSRQIQGSKRYEKNLLLQQKRAAKAARIRKNELEVYTTHLVRTYETIIYDDYSFKGALAVSKRDELYRCMKYEFILRLSQKLDERDSAQGHLIEVPHKKGVKTTRKCSDCGSENVHIRKDRTIQCDNCGYVEDRDYNAARNAYNYC